MDEKVLKEIIKRLEKEVKDEYVDFSDGRYKPVKMSTEYFKQLRPIHPTGEFCFIDGSNYEIISSADFSLHFIRIAAVLYQHGKRISISKYEQYCFASARRQEGGIKYTVELYPSDKLNLIFDSLDETIKEGKNRAKVTSIPGIARRLLEIKKAEEMIDKISSGGIVVLDGTLQANVTFEAGFLESLYKKAMSKDILITALAKTCTLMTNEGRPVTALLTSKGELPLWYYHPVAEINSPEHQAEMYFVKLHQKSDYAFRFEVYNKQKQFDAGRVIGMLAFGSRDPLFRGYPYGLVEAHKASKITKQEKEQLLTRLMIEAGDKWKLIKAYLASVDSHSVLDRC